MSYFELRKTPHGLSGIRSSIRQSGWLEERSHNLYSLSQSWFAQETVGSNADGIYDYADVEFLIHNLLDTHIGDANVDGTFDSRDFVQVFRSAEYEDGTAGNSLWSEGDWNCDGDFTTRDFVWAFRDGGYVLAAERRLPLVAAATANQSRQARQSSEKSKDKTNSQVDREPRAAKQLDAAVIDLIFDDIDLRESDGSETEPLGSIHQI